MQSLSSKMVEKFDRANGRVCAEQTMKRSGLGEGCVHDKRWEWCRARVDSEHDCAFWNCVQTDQS